MEEGCCAGGFDWPKPGATPSANATATAAFRKADLLSELRIFVSPTIGPAPGPEAGAAANSQYAPVPVRRAQIYNPIKLRPGRWPSARTGRSSPPG